MTFFYLMLGKPSPVEGDKDRQLPAASLLFRFFKVYLFWILMAGVIVYAVGDMVLFYMRSPPPYGPPELKEAYEQSSVNFHYNLMMDRVFWFLKLMIGAFALSSFLTPVVAWLKSRRDTSSIIPDPPSATARLIHDHFQIVFRGFLFQILSFLTAFSLLLFIYAELEIKYLANLVMLLVLAPSLSVFVVVLVLPWMRVTLQSHHHFMNAVIANMLSVSWLFVMLYVMALASIWFRFEGKILNLPMEFFVSSLPGIAMLVFCVIYTKRMTRTLSRT